MGLGRRHPARVDLDAETVPAKVNRSDAGVAHAGERLEDLSFLARHSRSTCQACYTVIGKSRRRVRRVRSWTVGYCHAEHHGEWG
jgi:hypothetical protein